MKKVTFISAIIAILTYNVSGQWTTGTNPTTLDNVGIGTNLASEKLSITSGWGVSGCAYTGVPALKINWTVPTTVPPCPTGITGVKPSVFEINRIDFSTTPLLVLKDNGNLGIGKSDPLAKLDVLGTTTIEGNQSADVVRIFNNRPNVLAEFSPLVVSYSSIQNNNPYLIKLRGFNSGVNVDRMVVRNNGQVGIGVSNPEYKLCIGGGIIVDNLEQFNGNVTNTGENSVVKFGAAGHGEAIGSTKVGTFNLHGLNFYTSYVSRMAITNSGAVTIGNVSTPTGYKLYVEQGILTEQVKVAIKTTNDWSDYVFAPDYKLMPLQDVENYIADNKHLPNVPSAEAVVQEGINMAKMDAKLLEKIEELTLYTIQLNKELKQLKEKMSILENKK